MKTHNQQQTKLNIETTAIEPIHSRQQRSEYKPRKWRGNTLVPVIIALAISAIATVAFLNQGADLTAKNKIVIGQNKIASALSDWVVSREATGGATAATTANTPPGPGNNIFGNAITYGTLSNAIAANASGFGNTNAIATNTRYLVYQTDDTNSCKILQTRFTGSIDGVGSGYCINNIDPEATSPAIAVGDTLVIMLD